MFSYQPDTGDDGSNIPYFGFSLIIHILFIALFFMFESPFKESARQDREKVMNVQFVTKKKKVKSKPTNEEQEDKQKKKTEKTAKNDQEKQSKDQPKKKITKKKTQDKPQKKKQTKEKKEQPEKKKKKPEKKKEKPEKKIVSKPAESIKKSQKELEQDDRMSVPAQRQKSEATDYTVKPETPTDDLVTIKRHEQKQSTEKYESVPERVDEVRKVSYEASATKPTYNAKTPDEIKIEEKQQSRSKFGQSTTKLAKAKRSDMFEVEPGKSQKNARELSERPPFPYEKYSQYLPDKAILLRYELVVAPDGTVNTAKVINANDFPKVAERIISWLRKWKYAKSATTDRVSAVVHVLKDQS